MTLRSLAMVLTLLAASGCGLATEQKLLSAAAASMAKGDDRAAVVQMKEAIQSYPESAEARFLFGTALSKTGDMTSAAVEFQKAYALKFDESRVIPKLVEAMLASGQMRKATEQFGDTVLSDTAAQAELKALLGSALLTTGQFDAGRELVDKALALNPSNLNANLLKARLLAGKGDFDGALALADKAVLEHPQRPEAFSLKGELLLNGKADYVGAKQAFLSALAADPKYRPAMMSMTGLMLQMRDVKGFQEQIATLRKNFPDQMETRFYQALSAYYNKDFPAARETILQLLRLAPDNPYVLQLGGAIELESGSGVLAETRLNKALAQLPGLASARRLLAELQVRNSEPGKALATLQPLLTMPKPDGPVLAQAAQAYLLAGDSARAERYYQLAAKADDKDPVARAGLALAQIAEGQVDLGFASLEQAASADVGTYADLALYSARMSRNDFDGAQNAVTQLQAKLKGKPLPFMLEGQLKVQRKDFAGARVAFERAATAESSFYPAVAALSELDVLDRKLPLALKRQEAFLSAHPDQLQATLAVAELKLRLGAKGDEIAQMLTDAVRKHPGEVSARLAQVNLLLTQNKKDSALAAAQQALASFPDDPRLLDALGRAQGLGGDFGQAIATFHKLTLMEPRKGWPWLRLAEAQLGARNPRGAEQSLRRALTVEPGLLDAKRSLIRLAVAERRLDDAVKLARSVQQERPKEASGFVMEGEIEAGRRAWDAAIRAFKLALEREPSTESAKWLMATYGNAGRQADADSFASKWASAHPQDTEFLFHLANLAQSRNDYAGAESRFRQLLTLVPDSPTPPNNLAWLLLVQNKPGALPLAEQANQLMPSNPAVLDTLGMALSADKQWAKAVERQQQAVDLAPDVPGYRLRLAKYQIAAGQKDAAKLQLDKLLALGDKFAGQGEAKAMLKGL